MKYKGYTICNARPTGGKAGKGCNKTSTVQIFKDNMLMKAFRFRVGEVESYVVAKNRAKEWVDAQPK